MGFSRHEWPLMCCICFKGLTPETCAVDADGVKWDVCKGECARSTWDWKEPGEENVLEPPNDATN